MHEPTVYAEINTLLYRLLIDAKSVLVDEFLGMYLHGSLALGDFKPHRSDIDFVIVTNDPLSQDDINKLISMHREITTSGGQWASMVEANARTALPPGRSRVSSVCHPDNVPYPVYH